MYSAAPSLAFLREPMPCLWSFVIFRFCILDILSKRVL
jgi:hypothetical protein